MPFTQISLVNFRNIEQQKIPVHSEQVFFVGPNGQGKTNILEALYMLSYGRSFRIHRDEPLLRHGCSQSAVHGSWRDVDGTVEAQISIKLEKGRKDIRLNDSAVKDRKELAELIPSIIFSHDDIDFVKGSPENQRWFFNQCLSTYKMSYIDELRKYAKLLKSRNNQLREQKAQLLDVLDIQLAAAGRAIVHERQSLIEEFNKLFTPLFASVSGIDTELKISYRPSWKNMDEREVVSHLSDHRSGDFALGTTTSGPHRDRFLFRFDGRDFIKEASTGQLRLMSLCLRAAQSRLYARMTGKAPVLLLDDVLLELDGKKREKFMAELPDYQQAFFTFLPDENIQLYHRENALVYRVQDGSYVLEDG